MKDEPRVFLARAGGSGEDEDLALDNNFAIIGFREVASLEQVADRDELAKLVEEAYPDKNTNARKTIAGQLWAFVCGMEEGDIVVLPRKITSQIALGRVAGPYRYGLVNSVPRHTRPVKWELTDIPRAKFEQDMLYSFGAFLTVCNISRNDASVRVHAVLNGKPDPGPTVLSKPLTGAASEKDQPEALPDLAQVAHDQVVARIQSRFAGHALTRLVDAVLQAEGWVTSISASGPDGGVDILAGRGSLGLDPPRLCVQVKSKDSPVDVVVYRSLQGAMQSFKAEQGLLVSWGGFKGTVRRESRQGYFTVRLWESRDLVRAIYRNFESLPAEIQAELPLKRVWMLVPEEPEE